MTAATFMNFLLASGASPCFAAAVALAPPNMRGVASTILLAAMGVIGSAMSPLIVGAVSDALMPRLGAESLRYALATMTLVPLVSAAILWLAHRRSATGAPAFA
jgi:MFS family permease